MRRRTEPTNGPGGGACLDGFGLGPAVTTGWEVKLAIARLIKGV